MSVGPTRLGKTTSLQNDSIYSNLSGKGVIVNNGNGRSSSSLSIKVGPVRRTESVNSHSLRRTQSVRSGNRGAASDLPPTNNQPLVLTPQADGIAHIKSSLSNTIISITDHLGNVLTWSSAGSSGFKGSRRSIQYAAQLTGENVARKSVQLGVKVVEARIQGIGFGKDSALRGLQLGGLKIIQLCDITSIPHNGCRAPKKRRT